MQYRKIAADNIEEVACLFLCGTRQNTFSKELAQENMVWTNLKVNLVWDAMRSQLKKSKKHQGQICKAEQGGCSLLIQQFSDQGNIRKLPFLFLSEQMLSDQFAGIALAEAFDNTQ